MRSELFRAASIYGAYIRRSRSVSSRSTGSRDLLQLAVGLQQRSQYNVSQCDGMRLSKLKTISAGREGERVSTILCRRRSNYSTGKYASLCPLRRYLFPFSKTIATRDQSHPRRLTLTNFLFTTTACKRTSWNIFRVSYSNYYTLIVNSD